MTLLALRNVSLSRGGRPVLEDIGFGAAAGDLIGVIGPNGAGKSTLLRLMAGLSRPDRGDIKLEDRDIGDWPRRDRARRIAYLPQHPDCHWPITVAGLADLGRLPHRGFWDRPTPGDAAAVAAALALADMGHLADRRLDRLSGGEAARAHLARALAGTPALLLADEPVADLDPSHALSVMDHLRRFAGQGGAVAVVLHDLSLASRYCDRLVLLNAGRIAAAGPPGAVLTRDRLADIYGISAVHGEFEDESYVVPWKANGPGDGGATP